MSDGVPEAESPSWRVAPRRERVCVPSCMCRRPSLASASHVFLGVVPYVMHGRGRRSARARGRAEERKKEREAERRSEKEVFGNMRVCALVRRCTLAVSCGQGFLHTHAHTHTRHTSIKEERAHGSTASVDNDRRMQQGEASEEARGREKEKGETKKRNRAVQRERE